MSLSSKTKTAKTANYQPRTSFRSPKEVSLNPFRQKAIQNMQKIPKGKVASYGQIAELSGKPGGAREVAWLLHNLGKNVVPWQRVVGASGKIMFPKRRKEFREQRDILRSEGVWVSNEGTIDLETYQWNKRARRARSAPKMFSSQSAG